MTMISLAKIIKTLRRYPILTAAQLDEVTQNLLPQFTDPQALCRDLLRRGWLTTFQARQLLHGFGGNLVFGSYLVLDRLGGGGNGQVFKVRHQTMGRVIALKVLHKDLLADEAAIGRFYREIEVISQLDHPALIHAYDADVVGQTYFLALEYVDGIDLDCLVRKEGPLPIVQACDYIRQASLGLQYAHEKGLVHRDVKPSNLLVARSAKTGSAAGTSRVVLTGLGACPWGVVKILDLGLARLQQPVAGSRTKNLTTLAGNQVMMGTPDYMAPEQALDFHRADIRADIYSLGCTFFFLLAGKPPFAGGSLPMKLLHHQQTPPPPLEQLRPEVPTEVAAVVAKMLNKCLSDRPQSPGEVAEQLAALMQTLSLLPAALPRPLTDASVKESISTIDLQLPPMPVSSEPPPPAPEEETSEAKPPEEDKAEALVKILKWLKGRFQRPGNWQGLAVAGSGLVLVGVLLIWFTGSDKDGGGTARNQASSTAANGSTPVYLADLPEQDVTIGLGRFGKNGDLGYGNGHIKVKGTSSRHGLSMHPPSKGAARVEYHLDKQYRTFLTAAALNDDVPASKTPLIFEVWGDGKKLWESKPMLKSGEVQECKVSVKGIARLNLKIDCPGEKRDAHAVWIEPRLFP